MTGRRVTVGNHCPWTRGNIGPHRGMWTIRLIGYSSSLGDGSPVTKICTRRNPNCAYVTIRRTLDGTCFRSHHFVNSVSGQHFSAGEKQKQQNLFSTFAGAVLWRHLKDHAKLTRLAGSGQLVWAAGCKLSLALVHARRPAWPGETSETILRVAPPR